MKRIFIFLSFIIVLALVSYFVWSLKDKDLNFVPENADAVVLIDVKELKKQYFFTFVKHPFIWSGDLRIASKNNGLEIPDFVQIFHLQNTNYSEWYGIFEIKNGDDFIEFLKEKDFKITKNNIYKNDKFSVKIETSKCVVGFSNSNFDKTTDEIFNYNFKNFQANQLINNSLASVSYFAKSKIHNFAVYLNDDYIEIKTKTVNDIFSSQISDLEKQTQFLKLNLDSKNVKIMSELFNQKLTDSININSVKAVSELESVNDKIVSYSYDDNFNEVQKVSYQKLVQPNYTINLQSSETEKLWSYFQNKKWINAENQFTAIPFQPNVIQKNSNGISIQSTRKTINFGEALSDNFIFVKNNALLIDLLRMLSPSDKKSISKVDFLFYGNKADDYYLKLKFKKEKLPIILSL